jgi:hemoglobin-like flavoprotein
LALQPEDAASLSVETPSRTPDRLAALRTFFAEMEPHLPAIVALTYNKMFAVEPDTVLLFKDGIREQQISFLGKLKGIVRLTRSSHLWPAGAPKGPILIPQIVEFGRSYAGTGVTPAHFVLMKEMMTRACKEVAPTSFTPPVEEALSFVFDVLAQSLTAADGSRDALSKLRLCQSGTILHDPAAYFDGEMPGRIA